jgi:hypothetical protein
LISVYIIDVSTISDGLKILKDIKIVTTNKTAIIKILGRLNIFLNSAFVNLKVFVIILYQNGKPLSRVFLLLFPRIWGKMVFTGGQNP